MEDNRPLLDLLMRYAHVFLIPGCDHCSGQWPVSYLKKLTRRVLMGCGRTGSQLPLTLDFLVLMLGVRRSRVTHALHRPEGLHAIRAERGRVFIKSVGKLLELPGAIYGIAEKEHERHIRSDWRY